MLISLIDWASQSCLSGDAHVLEKDWIFCARRSESEDFNPTTIIKKGGLVTNLINFHL